MFTGASSRGPCGALDSSLESAASAISAGTPTFAMLSSAAEVVSAPAPFEAKSSSSI